MHLCLDVRRCPPLLASLTAFVVSCVGEISDVGPIPPTSGSDVDDISDGDGPSKHRAALEHGESFSVEREGTAPDTPVVEIGFSYPVGDKENYPAGGWNVMQVLGHYNPYWGGRHMAQDLVAPGGGVATIDQPVYSIGDGIVRYAGTNGSTYRHVVLIEHELEDGSSVCSFYGHLNAPVVETGDYVERGQEVASVMDWAEAASGGSSSNTHLHYVVLSKELCDASANAGGALVCGYDNGLDNDIETIEDEPYTYTSVGDPCYDHLYESSFISPTQFVEEHHFSFAE